MAAEISLAKDSFLQRDLKMRVKVTESGTDDFLGRNFLLPVVFGSKIVIVEKYFNLEI